MLVLGSGSTHLVTAANLWPRYDHIESLGVMEKVQASIEMVVVT